jgi:hypothetical protein
MRSTIPRVQRASWLSRGLGVTGLCCLLLAGLLAGTASAQRSTVLSGYVFGYDGKVLESATVTVYRMPQHDAIGPAVQTNANGEWSIDTGDGIFAVRAEHPGYGFSEVTVYPTSYTTGIAFMLPVARPTRTVPLVASVSGRVTDLDGVPLGGMTVYATEAQDTGVKQIVGPPTLSATTTDADGHYTLQIPAGEIWLGIKTGASWGYQRNPRTVQAGQSFTERDFVVAIRTGVQYIPPTSTPTGNVGGIVGGNPGPSPGMPVTGQPALSPWPGLLVVALLTLLAGGILRRQTRPR